MCGGCNCLGKDFGVEVNVVSFVICFLCFLIVGVVGVLIIRVWYEL